MPSDPRSYRFDVHRLGGQDLDVGPVLPARLEADVRHPEQKLEVLKTAAPPDEHQVQQSIAQVTIPGVEKKG